MNETNAVKIEGLTKRYGSVSAVDDISFTVKKGSLIGFLGVNGAGKSTTINMMSTLLEPTAGSIEICGHDVKKDAAAVRRKMGIVYQNNVLDELLTVKENLLCRGILHGADKKRAQEKLEALCRIFSLKDILKKKYRTLSGGQKRRCEIAAALMHTPEILVLDEPTTGLDPAARKEVWSTIEELRRSTEMTVFLTTHYMEEAADADKIIIINKGRIAAQGLPHELKERYASDSLKLYCTEQAASAVAGKLGMEKLGWENNYVRIPLASTKDALPILERVSGDIESFEVVQGTMDDVFLNAAKGEDENESVC